MFDSNGNPLTITEGSGRVRTVAYDGLGRIRNVSGGVDYQVFDFNGLKAATFSTKSAGQTTSVSYGYTDGYGRINTEIVTPPSGSGWSQSYGYDPSGRLSSLTYPDGKIVTYGYDDANNYGRVVSVSVNGTKLATVGDGVTPSTAYDGWGNLSKLTFSSGANDAWTYTPDGLQIKNQIITPIGGTATTRSYGYDGLNHLTQAGEWTNLTHDALGELTQATGLGVSDSFTYDGYANNTSSVSTGNVPQAFTNFTFNPINSNQIPSTTPNGIVTGWNYNGNGEALSIGSAIGSSAPSVGFGWDGLGRLSTATLNNETEIYAYLPGGFRVQLLDYSNPTNNRRFAYAANGLLLTEYTGAGSSWAWKGDVIYLGSMAIAEIDAAGVHELHDDHLGTPRIITNGATGNVEGVQAFGPFGEAMGSGYSNGYRPMTGYTGHTQTDPWGLIYMRGRYYSPTWHRFLNSDHGLDPNQLNQFAYVGGGPFTYIDPLGLWEWRDLWSEFLSLFGGGASQSGDWTLTNSSGGTYTYDNGRNYCIIDGNGNILSEGRDVSATVTVMSQTNPDVGTITADNSSWLSRHLPGYVTLGGSFKELGNLTLNFTLSRNGTIFFTPQVGGGASLTGLNGALVAGYLDGPNNGSGQAVDGYLTGAGSNLMLGAIGGFSKTGNGSQTGMEYGVMTPQASFGFGYGIPLFTIPGVHW